MARSDRVEGNTTAGGVGPRGIQTGAILSACWAKAHGMTLMVHDLANPMLAQIPSPAFEGARD